MLPPTYLTCLEVGQYADPDAVVADAHDRVLEMHQPEPEPLGNGQFTLTMPPHLRPVLAAHRGA